MFFNSDGSVVGVCVRSHSGRIQGSHFPFIHTVIILRYLLQSG